MLRQRLQDPAGDAEAALRRLVRIGGRADEHRVAAHEREVARPTLPQRARQHLRGVPLHQDAALERKPRRQLAHHVVRGVARRQRREGTVQGVPVREARVAVAAPDGAPDVGIDGPVVHPRRPGIVEHGTRGDPEVPDVLLLAEGGKLASRVPRQIGEERRLLHCVPPEASRRSGLACSTKTSRVLSTE